MSVDFNNVYQEVLFDNLISVIKQNFIFQSQLKLTENLNQQKEMLERNVMELTERINSMMQVAEQADVFRQKAGQVDSLMDEKNRIQTAYNENAQKLNAAENIISSLRNEISSLHNTIKNIESDHQNEISLLKQKYTEPQKEVTLPEKTKKNVTLQTNTKQTVTTSNKKKNEDSTQFDGSSF